MSIIYSNFIFVIDCNSFTYVSKFLDIGNKLKISEIPGDLYTLAMLQRSDLTVKRIMVKLIGFAVES